ncbi:efflux RND transporter permease subunit [Myxococcota bacterium]|nr:efflux RND transporter permease subunit [Myxococcota bacterium]MBU1383179.1 efflux RND transporter permease subunit [Myxococcota bacterium]MBU1497185.1 efflux RND transporter permease subunit [Myxococcota bacterium]
MNLIYLLLKRKTAVFALAILFVVMGSVGFNKISVDFLPDVNYPLIKVHIWWKNATPGDIDIYISDVVEREISGLEGLDYLESSAIEGSYTLQVNFKYEADRDAAFMDVQAAMNRAIRKLPKDIEPPVIIKADPQQLPVLRIAVSSNVWREEDLREWVEQWLQPRIMAVNGVAGLDVIGGKKHEIRIHPDLKALVRYGITEKDLAAALEKWNVELFAGRIDDSQREFIARTNSRFKNVNDIKNVVVKQDGIAVVTVGQLANVISDSEEVRFITRFNGAGCVNINIYKAPDAGTVDVSKRLAAKLREIQGGIEKHIDFRIFENQADYVDSALKGVQRSALQAILLVVFVTLIFLRSLRMSLILITVLPVILITSFFFMNLARFTLNIFTMAGLIIATGMALDNSIIVTESLSRVVKQKTGDFLHRIAVSVAGIFSPLMASTLAIMSLFVPFVMVSGLTAVLFRELVFTVAIIVFVSVVAALLFVPSMAAMLYGFGRKNNDKSDNQDQKNISDSPEKPELNEKYSLPQRIYSSVISYIIRFRIIVGLLLIIGLLVGFYTLKTPGSEFLPEVDDGRIMIKIKLPTGSTLKQTDGYLQRVESIIASDDIIESYSTLSGGKMWGLYTFESAVEGEINIQMVPPEMRKTSVHKYMIILRKKLQKIKIPGGKLMVRKMRVKGLRKMGEADLEIQVKGTDLNKLYKYSGNLGSKLSNRAQLANVHLAMDATKPELVVDVDRLKATRYGVDPLMVAKTVRNLAGGLVATKFRKGDLFYNITVRLPENELNSPDVLTKIPLKTPAGNMITVGDLAKVRHTTGPVEILRDNQLKFVLLRADVGAASLGEALETVKKEVKALKMPPGYEVTYSGKARLMTDIKTSTVTVLLFSLFFAFIILTIQFNNFRYGTMIILTAPLSLAGCVVALNATGHIFGGTVLLGLIIVISAHINDSVLLFAESEHQAQTGLWFTKRDVICAAATIRAKPRIMTTLTTIAGFVPLAISRGEGSDMLVPMAYAAIGGLVFEIVTALFIIPLLFSFIFSFKTPESKTSQLM